MLSGSLSVSAHEMAHNLGLNHASSDWGDQGTSISEYGDVTDTCGGGGVASLNAPHRKQMGYLPPTSITEHSAIEFMQSCTEYTADGRYQWCVYGQ